MFSDYLLERENVKTLTDSKAGFFFTWRLTDDGSEFHILDMFIKKENRNTHTIGILIDRVAKMASEANTKYIVSSVDISTNNPEKSLALLLKLGFKLLKNDNNLIYLSLPTRAVV